MINSKPKLTLILGSGFSAESSIPTTSELSSTFLDIMRMPAGGKERAKNISDVVQTFWEDIFGFQPGGTPPSLEDHFTMLDLAANSGHYLGPGYSPKHLRAIRRMSIHKTFDILNSRWGSNGPSMDLLSSLSENFDLSIVSLNWDIIVEQYLYEQLKIEFTYTVPVTDFFDRPLSTTGIPLLKMHGSANWLYCDSCRSIYAGLFSKDGLLRGAYMEKSDFELFGLEEENISTEQKRCLNCGAQMAGRVATFSYRKAFSIAQFHTIWENAYRVLSQSDQWLFIGYSMPAADFEFKHLLKSAQHAREDAGKWRGTVILKDDTDAANRYKRFFGLNDGAIIQVGMAAWVKDSSMNQFIAQNHS